MANSTIKGEEEEKACLPQNLGYLHSFFQRVSFKKVNPKVV
jgi:hypothetical protein